MRFTKVVLGTLMVLTIRELPHQAEAQQQRSSVVSNCPPDEFSRCAHASENYLAQNHGTITPPEQRIVLETVGLGIESEQTTVTPPEQNFDTTVLTEMALTAAQELEWLGVNESAPEGDRHRYQQPSLNIPLTKSLLARPNNLTVQPIALALIPPVATPAVMAQPLRPSTTQDTEAKASIDKASTDDISPPNIGTDRRELWIAQTDPTAITTVEQAEQLDRLRQQYQLPQLPDLGLLETNPNTFISTPGISIGSPTAFGADWRDVFAGSTFQERARFTNRSDGAIGLGFGLGDAEETVGLEVTLTIVDLLGEGAFEDGGLSFKLHRQFKQGWAIAAGVENLLTFGSTDGGSSGYGVVSKTVQLRERHLPLSTITTSVGVGGGRFRSAAHLDNDGVNVFGSIGIRLLQPLSFVADWTGQNLNLGLSIAPFKNFPLVITPAAADVTGSAGDGTRFILGVGWSGRF